MAVSDFSTGNHAEGAVSWGAVLAGAVGAAAFSLILILLGTGIGLSAVSPWSSNGISAEAIGVSTILWITLVQALASVLGGYLAGRLRTRWVTVHTNEVFFRDTAHGFLAWSVATLLMATLLSSAIAASLSTGLKVAGAAAGTAVTGVAAAASKAPEPGSGLLDYYVDVTLRGPASSPAATPAPIDNQEVVRAFGHGIATGDLSEDDIRHLGQVVSSRTGLSQPDAEKRVTESFTQLKSALAQASTKAKQVADDARKTSAYTALWLVISLLLGAFLASLAATFGGRLRDSASLATS